MKIKKFLFLILFVGVIFITGFLLYRNQTKTVEAGVGQNVFGWAWSSNIGWISMNSLNCDTNDDGLSNGNPPNCPAIGTPIPSYGVNIIDNGSTGIFSGHAWSSNAGWIDFDEADLVGCPSGTCRAWVNKLDGLVYGWAKIRSVSTGEWVRLRGNYCNISINKSTGDFSGWAWGGETAGRISFNCNQTETGSVCPIANYKVTTSFDMNIKPTVAVGASPNPVSINLCSNPAYNFAWVFNDLDVGDTQRQYQLQVDFDGNWNNNTLVAGEVDITAVSSALNKEILLAKTPGVGSNQLAYNKTYSWRVRVWDNHPSSPNSISDWVYGVNFTTPIHIYPTPMFDWSPKLIIQDQLIQFSSEISECYDNSNNKISCAGANFLWTLPTATTSAEFASGTTAVSKNPVIKFDDSGNNQRITLRITDNVGFCSTSTNVRVTLPLPKWKEILPQ